MVLVGVQDSICPFETVMEACEAIPYKNKKIYSYDGHGHDAGRSNHVSITKKYFNHYLK